MIYRWCYALCHAYTALTIRMPVLLVCVSASVALALVWFSEKCFSESQQSQTGLKSGVVLFGSQIIHWINPSCFYCLHPYDKQRNYQRH